MFKEENFGQINQILDKEQAISPAESFLKERNSKQIKLIAEYFEFITGQILNMENKNERDDAAEYFGEKGFFTVYGDLLKSEIFKTHKRLQGKISNITVQDLIQYQQDETLPE